MSVEGSLARIWTHFSYCIVPGIVTTKIYSECYTDSSNDEINILHNMSNITEAGTSK